MGLYEEDQIGIFLKEMIYNAMEEKIREGIGYDGDLVTTIDYESITSVTISVLHILPTYFFERRLKSAFPSKNFLDVYQ